MNVLKGKLQQGYSYKESLRKAIYVTQFPGFVESYYLDALWIENFCVRKDKIPKDLLFVLSRGNVGELMSIWGS